MASDEIRLILRTLLANVSMLLCHEQHFTPLSMSVFFSSIFFLWFYEKKFQNVPNLSRNIQKGYKLK